MQAVDGGIPPNFADQVQIVLKNECAFYIQGALWKSERKNARMAMANRMVGFLGFFRFMSWQKNILSAKRKRGGKRFFVNTPRLRFALGVAQGYSAIAAGNHSRRKVNGQDHPK